METIWMIICYLVFLGSFFGKRMIVLKENNMWLARIAGLVIIIAITWVFNIEGVTYLFWLGLGINFLKTKYVDESKLSDKQKKDALDYKEKDDQKEIKNSKSISEYIQEKIAWLKNNYVTVIIVGIICIGMMIFSMWYDNYVEGQSKEETSKIIEEQALTEEIVLTVNKIKKNPSKYKGKEVTVQGTLHTGGNVFVNGDMANIRPALYGENNEYIVLLGEWPMQDGVKNVKVIGEISIDGDEVCLTAESYNYDNAVSIDSQNEANVNTPFSLMREASKGAENLNWNQFLKNPTSLANTYIYVTGEVVDMDVSNGVTSGLIDVGRNGNIDEMVSFTINGEVYDFREGDIIAPIGYISSETGSAINNMTYETVETPLIVVENPSMWKTEYEVDLTDEEIKDFLYGTYEAIDSNDVDKNLGESFEFTADTIGGYSYRFKDMASLNPAIEATARIGLGDDSFRIGMDLVAEGIGLDYVDGGVKVTTFSIDLYGNGVSVNSDGYSHKYHKKP